MATITKQFNVKGRFIMKLDDKNVLVKRPGKTVYRDGNKVIKLFDSQYSMADILNEALNQARVMETGLNIPKLHGVTEIEGKTAIVLDYIEGKTFEQMMNEHPEKMDEFLDRFIAIQADVHSRKAPMLNRQYDKFYKKISDSSFDATTRYDLHSRLDSMKRHDKLCHGDFNPSNIIITSNDDVYILDWAHATQGNASADVARTYLLFYLSGREEFADKYLNLFCERTDTAKQYVQKWLPIVAASQSVKGNKEEVGLLSRWVNVVDYM